MTSFRFAALSVLLTYSQVPDEVTKEAVLYTIDDRYPIHEYVLGEEQHEDGGRHIHACITFTKKVDSRDVTCFDINTGTEQLHPNIQPVKRGKAHLDRARDYCRKEDDDPLQNITEGASWAEILNKANSAEEFMQLIKENYPRDFCLSHDRLLSMAAKTWKEDSVNTINEYSPPPNIPINVELTYADIVPNKSIIVVGPAGCGKTTWAKTIAPKPALFVRHLDSLSELRREHQSIIFDDLDFKHMPPSAQKFLVDMENLSEIHIRYRVAKIPAGTLRIFTANEYPFLEGGVHGEAIDRRVNKMFI
jgi:hypothetical protein|nr:MAG: replication associated protein [Cressdnaviricota sp.]